MTDNPTTPEREALVEAVIALEELAKAWPEDHLPPQPVCIRMANAINNGNAILARGCPEGCPRCDRGEVFGMSDDSGFWVEMGSVAGGANAHGRNGWLELIEHHPDGREVRREYVATDSPLYAAPQPCPEGWVMATREAAVEAKARELFAARWGDSAPWTGGRTKRSYWRRKARAELAAAPQPSGGEG